MNTDDPLIAKADAFESSELAVWHRRHRDNAYDPRDLRSPYGPRSGLRPEHPDAAAFLFDLSEGAPFEIDAFIALISKPFVHPMRLEWVRGKFDYWPEPEDGPCVNDAVAGDFVGLAWGALRCGFGPALFARLAEIETEIADPIVAMLATFDEPECRQAAARHFGLPGLPAAMETVFSPRLSLDDILRLADFGRDHPRFATALAQALQDYNLHIYSNAHPQADWFLDGLEQYSYAKGGRLVFLFIRCPERVPVLARMLEKGWLVSGVGRGGYDGYRNTGHALFQAAVMNRLLCAPAEAAYWLETPWIAHYVRKPTFREVTRHAAALAKRKPRVPPQT